MNFYPGRRVFLFLMVWFITSTAKAGLISSTTGFEWRDLSDTTSISAQEMDNACNDITFACSGSVLTENGASVSVDGWNWASLEQVESLFGEIYGAPLATHQHNGEEVTSNIFQVNSDWAPVFISHFSVDRTVNNNQYSIGITRDTVSNNTLYQHLFLVQNGLFEYQTDAAYFDQIVLRTSSSQNQGHFMYRSVAVSEPSSLFFLMLGLSGLMLFKRKNKAS